MVKVRGRSYTPRELRDKLVTMGPKAYARNIRYVANGPKRKATIAAVSRLSQGALMPRALGYPNHEALRQWVRTDAWVLPWGEPNAVAAAAEHVPALASSAQHDGERALRREFDLLGSGPFTFGGEIDWLLDFKTGMSWPQQFYSKIDYANLDRPSDVKVPWEVSRCHQLVDLARAYLFEPNPKLVEEAAAQFNSWIDANPLGRTINWACTMEVGIRSVNWIWSLAVFAPVLDNRTLDRVLASLVEHAIFTSQNLEVSEVAGNHYISDALGLVAIGSFFRDSKLGRRWLSLGRDILVDEIEKQVYSDGVDHEMSIPYHRLVAEIFLVGGLLLRGSDADAPSTYWDRLEKMFDFMMSYSRPDGSVPIWGDADDGRVVTYGDRHLDSHGHLLSTAAVLYQRPDFAVAALRLYEDTFWMLGEGAGEAFAALRGPVPVSPLSVFPEGGFVVLRADDLHVLLDAGPVGLRGRGGHGHNDACAVEIWMHGAPLVVDPGCLVYTANVDARQSFRSTRAHNTPQLADHEINTVLSLWQMVDDAQATILAAETTSRGVRAVGAHVGFKRFDPQASVQREVALDGDSCLITDSVGGTGPWSVRWTFAHGVQVLHVDNEEVLIRRAGTEFRMSLTGAEEVALVNAVVAPSYGVALTADAIDVRIAGERCAVRFHAA